MNAAPSQQLWRLLDSKEPVATASASQCRYNDTHVVSRCLGFAKRSYEAVCRRGRTPLVSDRPACFADSGNYKEIYFSWSVRRRHYSQIEDVLSPCTVLADDR